MKPTCSLPLSPSTWKQRRRYIYMCIYPCRVCFSQDFSCKHCALLVLRLLALLLTDTYPFPKYDAPGERPGEQAKRLETENPSCFSREELTNSSSIAEHQRGLEPSAPLTFPPSETQCVPDTVPWITAGDRGKTFNTSIVFIVIYQKKAIVNQTFMGENIFLFKLLLLEARLDFT